MVAQLGLGLSLVIGAVLVAAPLQLASKTETATMRVTVTVAPSCLITSTYSSYRVNCAPSSGPFRIYSTATAVHIDF